MRLVRAADAAGAPASAIEDLHAFLDTRPDIPQRLALVGSFAEKNLIKQISGGSPSTLAMIKMELKGIRDRLGYKDSPQLEQLIIADIVMAWLAMQHFGAQMAASQTARGVGYWEKNLASAQKRFLRAGKMLEQIRQLTAPASPIANAAASAYLREAIVKGLRSGERG